MWAHCDRQRRGPGRTPRGRAVKGRASKFLDFAAALEEVDFIAAELFNQSRQRSESKYDAGVLRFVLPPPLVHVSDVSGRSDFRMSSTCLYRAALQANASGP